MNDSRLIFHSSEDVELAIREYLFNTSMNIPYLLFNFHFNLIVVSVTCILTFLTCIAGIVGNGVVIHLLGFGMKRSPFTNYVLNLAVADIGVLVACIFGYVAVIMFLWSGAFSLFGFYIYARVWELIWAFTYIADQLLLTVISVDRCVAVLFPLWHRFHRPPHLSGVVCVSIWVLSLLIIGADFFLSFVNEFVLLQFIVNVAICTPVMAISTIILFAKMCTKSRQRKRGKLLPVISLALFLFLLFGFPINYCYVVIYCYVLDDGDVESLTSTGFELSSQEFLILFSKRNLILIPSMVAFVCTVLNCSLNPLIYFLVGRKKRGQSRQSMKLALHRIFKDEGYCREREGPQAET